MANNKKNVKENTIQKLHHLSIVKKVTSELGNHIGIEDSVLSEFIIDLAQKSETKASFTDELKKVGAAFEETLIASLFRIIKKMSESISKTSVSTSHKKAEKELPETKKAFPGLSIPNTAPVPAISNEEKKQIDIKSKISKIKNKQLMERNREIVLNQIYEGVVTMIKDFGFFVRLLNTRDTRKEGLVHISMISTTRVNNIHQEVKRNQKVFVKVISITHGKIGLSMRLIDQRTGEDSSRDFQDSQSKSLEERIRGRERELQGRAGPAAAVKRARLTSPERWELSQLRNSGALAPHETQLEDPDALDVDLLEADNSESDENPDIEINDDEPPFLENQTEKSVRLSPIRVVKNPDGSLSRAALTQSALTKERRELKEQALRAGGDALPTGIGRSWEDPMASASERYLAQQLHMMGKRDEDAPMWKRQNVGRNVSFGKVTDKTLREQKESLPIFKLKRDLLAAIASNDVLVVIGATGSGKTTQMTQYLVEAGYAGSGKIGCTQPRRVAAMSIAKRVAEEFGCRLGQQVGYAIRFEDCTSPDTVIKYMTDGMLLREALLDKYLRDYSVIILDEAHERTVHTDVLFGLMKQCVRERPELKLIVTSATLDAAKFATYFNECPIFTIPGRLFPTTILYSKAPEADYVDAALMTVMQIHLSEPPGDILLFLTGKEEIDSTCERLYERMQQLGPRAPELIILPVYSALPAEMQSRIFEPAPAGKRKCVVATNIAEASLTIDGIFYVVDPGFVKQKVYNAKLGLDSLTITPISQASANQRAGRSGRTGPGQCYRLYTETAFENEMLECSVPEIQRTNLGNIVLTLKAMGINDLLNFDFMDPPPTQTLIAAMQSLYALGALDDEGLLTRLGRKMAEFPLEPMQSKILIQSVDFGCSEEVLTIVAMLSADNIWYRPREKQALADSKRARFFQAEGDHLTLLTVYREWERHNFSNSWCLENFIQTRSMRRAQDVRKQLAIIMDRYQLDIVSCGRNFTKVRRAIVSGYFRHVAKKDPQEGYKTLLEGQQVFIHPSSALFNRQPPWVIYHHLMLTTKEYMHDVIAINPKWLVELAPRSFKNTDPTKLSRQKKRERIEPLYSGNLDPNAWRLSRR